MSAQYVWTCLLFAMICASASFVSAQSQNAEQQELFESPESAVNALAHVVDVRNRALLQKIFGPMISELSTGDPDQDEADLQRFSAALQRGYRFENEGDDKRWLIVGPTNWEFPVPLVREANGWRFDTEAGVELVLDRRVGRNELDAIAVCGVYVDAQKQYFAMDPDGDGVQTFAERMRSTPGKRDGLYWPHEPGTAQSPLGPFVAEAMQRGDLSEDATGPQPYRGYYYKILTRRGGSAPGGSGNYIDKAGRMTGGFALLTWPAEYGKSGVMSFMVADDGVVFERDLGPETQKIAEGIDSYNPSAVWARVSVSSQSELPSWNEGAARQAIIDFVERVTDEAGEEFVPAAERVAVFDNDGTLWAEQPAYFQLLFALDRVKAMAADGGHPEWKTTEPFKSALAGDMKGLMATGEQGLAKILAASHTNMTSDEFADSVRQWLETAKHPKTGRPYNEMVYQPMLELLNYLRDNGFKTYIVSGGGIDFMRVFAEKTYGIPPEQVVGSSVEAKFDMRDGVPTIVKQAEGLFVDDKEGKPVGIYQHIGRKPIFAAGNSDGDLQMLQYTTIEHNPSFALIVQHTDEVREWAYDRESHIGQLDKALDEAARRGWTVVNMKEDWSIIYPKNVQ